MIAIASSTNNQRRSSRSNGVLVLDPPRHTDLPLAFLTPGKHLIGTSDACAIQIKAEGVEPRHAMILVGDQKILLKALDARTWINDSGVSEAALRPGDRLSIGPITYLARFATPDELLDFNPPNMPAFERADLKRSDDNESRNVTAIREPSASDPTAAPRTAPLIVGSIPDASDETRTVPAPPPDALPVSPGVVEEISTSVISTPVHSPSDTLRPPKPPTPILQQEEVETTLPATAHEPPFLDIQRDIAALNEQSEIFNAAIASVRATEVEPRLAAREDELKQLAAELSRQSQRLRDRNLQIAEREAELERKQDQLAVENERLVSAAQSTRNELADEYARQMALWKEWDAAYRRTTAELKSQLETVEQRRASIQAENERLASVRAEIQRLQAEYDSERREVAAERVQAMKELGDLHSQRSAFETERRQQLVELQEREALVASERCALAVAQDELLMVRQQFEHDRTLFATERSSESLRWEQEIREQAIARIKVNEQQSALQEMRFKLDSDRRSLEDHHAALKREREELEAVQSEENTLRARLIRAETELNLVRQSEHDHQVRIEAADKDAHHRQEDSDKSPQSPEVQRIQPEEIRNSIQRGRAVIAAARGGLGTSRATLPADGAKTIMSKIIGVLSGTSTSPANTAFSPNSQLSLADVSPKVSEQVVIETLSPATAMAELPSVNETLSAINHRFGFVATSTDSIQVPAENSEQSIQTPASEMDGELAKSSFEDSSDEAQLTTIAAESLVKKGDSLLDPVTIENAVEHLAESAPFVQQAPNAASSAGETSLSSLRAQLAQMFDLPDDSNSDECTSAEATIADESSEQSMNEASLTDSIEENTIETPSSDSQADDSSTFSLPIAPVDESLLEPAVPVSPVVASDVASNDQTQEEESDWTRRLRELSAVAGESPPSPSSPTPKVNEPESPEAAIEDEEFSVEAQLARLLGRPLTGGDYSRTAKTSAESKKVETKVAAANSLPNILPFRATTSDRSHLQAEPTHKQDKDAVREDIQSFRVIAQMSARTALAKYSRNNLRSEFYITSGLTAVSVVATVWYLGAFAYGIEPDAWKGITCALAAVLVAQKLVRSSSQLSLRRRKDTTVPVAANLSTTEELTVAN